LRNLADRLADMDVLQRPVKEDNGLSFYKYTYQVCYIYSHYLWIVGFYVFLACSPSNFSLD
jgi:hypothetical protein